MVRLGAYLSVLFLCLSSCFPFSPELRSKIDPTLTFANIKKDPTVYRGQKVLLGGVIVETKNKPEETILLVRQTELDLAKRPKNLDQTAGRFMVKYKGFLDPDIYRHGREITVIGDIEGKEVFPLGEIFYSYPLILAQEIKLWPKRSEYIPLYPWYWERPYFLCPSYYPW
ncbi:MAG: Slp family lipoprotein [Thermodesulfobacteriota bacterium]